MHVPDSVLEQVRNNGFAIMEGFLSTDELAEAQEGMFQDLPRPEDYFADADAHAGLAESQFAGIRLFPYQSWAVNRLAFHPDLVNAAERFCDTTDLQLYKVELWGKYSGAVDYDQPHHRDYGNHSLRGPPSRRPLAPADVIHAAVRCDRTGTDPQRSCRDRSVIGSRSTPDALSPGDLADEEISVTGPAGTLFLYTTDVLHRGSAITGQNRSRFVLLSDYSMRGNPWMGKMSWPGRAHHPGWTEMLARASLRERDLFGFPEPGNDYWNEQTVRDVGLRYPEMDMSPYGVATP